MASKGTAEGINIDVDKYTLGRTYEEKELLFKATQGVRHTVYVTRRVNLGNYEHIDLGMSINVPLALTESEVAMWDELTKEAIQRGINVINDEMEARVAKAKAQLKAQ
jgi:hypothetical protein